MGSRLEVGARRRDRKGGDDQRELDKLKLKAERLNKSSSQFPVQHGSLEEGKGDQESSGLKKVASELTSDRDHVNAELSAVAECLTKLNDMCIAKAMKSESQERAAEHCGNELNEGQGGSVPLCMRTHCCNNSDPCNGVYTGEVSCDSQLGCTMCRSTAVPFTCNITFGSVRLRVRHSEPDSIRS